MKMGQRSNGNKEKEMQNKEILTRHRRVLQSNCMFSLLQTWCWFTSSREPSSNLSSFRSNVWVLKVHPRSLTISISSRLRHCPSFSSPFYFSFFISFFIVGNLPTQFKKEKGKVKERENLSPLGKFTTSPALFAIPFRSDEFLGGHPRQELSEEQGSPSHPAT